MQLIECVPVIRVHWCPFVVVLFCAVMKRLLTAGALLIFNGVGDRC